MPINKQLPGIEWTHPHGRPCYTANPVRGCEHGCRWKMPDGSLAICYAETTANRLAKAGRAYQSGFKHLSFHPEALTAIRRCTEPSGIFLDSMSDLFGQHVPSDWILATLACIDDCPRHIFFTLTKNPSRLPQFDLSFPNLWAGISAPPTEMFGKVLTVEMQRTWLRRGLEKLRQVKAGVRWVSIEPLSFDAADILADFSDVLAWAVVGAASNGAVTYQPDELVLDRTLAALKCPVFFKGNLDRALAVRCAGSWRAEYPPAILRPMNQAA